LSDKSKIEWTDATWNPIRGCSRVSEGCRNCYAERIAARFSGPGQPYEGLAKIVRHNYRGGLPTGELGSRASWTGEVRFAGFKTLEQPSRWKQPLRVFVNSMSDLFHEKVTEEMLCLIFAEMVVCPQHVFQVLTKRPERMREWMSFSHGRGARIKLAGGWVRWHGANGKTYLDEKEIAPWPLPNVWLGVSVEDQATADARIPLLLETPAAVRWVSYEPALGPVDFSRWLRNESERVTDAERRARAEGAAHVPGKGSVGDIDWIVCGGESGPGARPMHPDWARSVRDQCAAAGVPFFFKQWGEWIDQNQAAYGTFACAPSSFIRVGKRAAGRLLDGREHNEYPRLTP
jgi:protein gp37